MPKRTSVKDRFAPADDLFAPTQGAPQGAASPAQAAQAAPQGAAAGNASSAQASPQGAASPVSVPRAEVTRRQTYILTDDVIAGLALRAAVTGEEKSEIVRSLLRDGLASYIEKARALK